MVVTNNEILLRDCKRKTSSSLSTPAAVEMHDPNLSDAWIFLKARVPGGLVDPPPLLMREGDGFGENGNEERVWIPITGGGSDGMARAVEVGGEEGATALGEP